MHVAVVVVFSGGGVMHALQHERFLFRSLCLPVGRSALELDDGKMADKASVENEETTIAKDIVVTKYKMAAEIVNGKCAL